MLSTNISFSTWIPCHTNKESLGKWKHNYGSNERSIGPVCQKSQTKIISEDQQWLLIADVFKSHWTKVKRSSGKMCHNNMTIIFSHSIFLLTEAVSPFYGEKHSPGILLKLRSRLRKAKKLMKLMLIRG